MTVQHCRRQKEKVSLSIILNPLSSCISLGITTKPDQIAPFPSQCRAVISDVHTHQTLTSLPKEFQTDRVISYVVKFYFWSTFSSISNEVLFSKAVHCSVFLPVQRASCQINIAHCFIWSRQSSTLRAALPASAQRGRKLFPQISQTHS